MINATQTFFTLCKKYTSGEKSRDSIGLLQEKTLHAVLKDFVSEDINKQEIKLGRYVADVFDANHITEIQTKSLKTLCKKLDFFLPNYTVTVVYPVCKTKWLYWIDAETGLVAPPRKSSKTGKVSHALAEIYGIYKYLENKNFNIQIFLLDAEEYRIKDGFGKDNKKYATKKDILPVCLHEIIQLDNICDLAMLVSDLPIQFTAKQLSKALGLVGRNAFYAKKLLLATNIIAETGKIGRATLFKRISDL